MHVNALPVWLFVSYGGGHVKALLPVAQRVRELGLAQPVYLALTAAAAVVRPTGIPVLGFRDVLRVEDTQALSHGRMLTDRLAVQTTDDDESVAYLGLSYAELESRLGVEVAAAQYAQFGRQAFLPLGVLERVFARVQPALVVTTNSPRAEQAAVMVARAKGIPCVCLLDLFGIWEREQLAQRDYADAVCVLNEGVRRFLMDAGRPGADVHVTGNPAFDLLADPGLRDLGRRARADAGWDGLRVILYAGSPEPTQIPDLPGRGDPLFPRQVEQALVALVQADERLALWVRRHPSEAPAHELERLRHPRIRVSDSALPLQSYLHGCDEVVVTVSTVGLEASLLGKPVTKVRGSVLDQICQFVELGVARRACTLDELPQAWNQSWPAGEPSSLEAGHAAADRVVAVLQGVLARCGHSSGREGLGG